MKEIRKKQRKMKRNIFQRKIVEFFLISVLCTFLCSFVRIQNKAVSQKLEHPSNVYIWSIEKPGFKTSYILGSIHVNVTSIMPPQWVEDKLRTETRLFLFELCPSELLEFEKQEKEKKILKLRDLPEGVTLDHLLSGSSYKKLAKLFLEIINTSEMKLKSTSPLGIVLFLMELSFLEFLRDKGHTFSEKKYDDHLCEIAKSENKEMSELDNLDLFLFTFSQLFDVIFLEKLLRDIDMDKVQNIEDVLKLIRRNNILNQDSRGFELFHLGDLESIEDLIIEIKQEAYEYYYLIFENRNHLWKKLIIEALERDSSFIVVGIGHLVGPHGLLKILKERGFSVKRLYE